MCMRERGEGDNLLNGKHLGKCYHLFNDEAKSMCTIGFRMEIGGGCLPASDADAEGFVRDSSAYFPQCDSETILNYLHNSPSDHIHSQLHILSLLRL